MNAWVIYVAKGKSKAKAKPKAKGKATPLAERAVPKGTAPRPDLESVLPPTQPDTPSPSTSVYSRRTVNSETRIPTAAKSSSYEPPQKSKPDWDAFRYRYQHAPQQIKDELAQAITKCGKGSPQANEVWWAIRGVDRGDYSGIVLQYSVTNSNTSGTFNSVF